MLQFIIIVMQYGNGGGGCSGLQLAQAMAPYYNNNYLYTKPYHLLDLPNTQTLFRIEKD